MLQDLVGVAFRKEHAVHHIMLKDQVAVARHVDIHDLDVRLLPADVILPGKRAPQLAIAPFIVDRVHAERRLVLIIDEMEQAPVADLVRAAELGGRWEEQTSETQIIRRTRYAVLY